MPRKYDAVDLAHTEPVFNMAKTVKREGVTDKITAKQLMDGGYRIPSHWRKADSVRQFVAWDGEGITYDGDSAQSYVLFGASTGDSIAKPSLGTRDCFDLLLSVESVYPDAIHVGYGLKYDCNMMLRDLSRRHLMRIYRTHKCRWEGYSIEYRPGKWLSIRRHNIKVRLFDVFGFFQSSFVKACEQFLSKDDPELERIREGKQARQSFTYDQLDTFIVPYWQAELRLLVRLMDSLRDDLTDAGLKVASWHGPGAVANTVFRTHNIGAAKQTTSKEINRAAQYAYAGGRFELFKAGHYPHSVWEYDIRSAYPSAIARLPNLNEGNWKHVHTFQPESFGVWRISYSDRRNVKTQFIGSQPLFHRDKHGNVSYPALVQGWYWTPEAALVLSTATILEGYVFVPDTNSKPFAFVEGMYEQRRQWKQDGVNAERALKLALNSLYGKMAQRAGWLQEGDPIPRWHQLEWAGYVTSYTRARLWEAMQQNPSAIIATETDALFSTQPLDLDLGDGLGQWEATEFSDITYLQSGLYYGTVDGKLVEKYRGFDKGSLPYESVLRYLDHLDKHTRCICSPPSLNVDCPVHLHGVTTRFIGMGIGLFTKSPWLSWQTEPRFVAFGGAGKRTHVSAMCPQCKRGEPLLGSLHTLCVITPGGRSLPHSLPWLSKQEPVLRQQEELERW